MISTSAHVIIDKKKKWSDSKTQRWLKFTLSQIHSLGVIFTSSNKTDSCSRQKIDIRQKGRFTQIWSETGVLFCNSNFAKLRSEISSEWSSWPSFWWWGDAAVSLSNQSAHTLAVFPLTICQSGHSAGSIFQVKYLWHGEPFGNIYIWFYEIFINTA